MSTLLINGHRASIDEAQFTKFHGASVFTTLRSHNGALVLWRFHWRRLMRHAQFFGYSVPNERDVIETIRPHIVQSDHKIRVLLLHNHYAITIEPYIAPASSIYHGVNTILSSWQVHPQLACYKTGNSLPYLCAHKEALASGAFEALLSNHDGFIVDGSRTSLLHFDGERMTALDGGLDGCMRAYVMETLERQGISCETRFLRSTDLLGQLFLANSLMGLVPVAPIKFAAVHEMLAWFRMDKDLSDIFATQLS